MWGQFKSWPDRGEVKHLRGKPCAWGGNGWVQFHGPCSAGDQTRPSQWCHLAFKIYESALKVSLELRQPPSKPICRLNIPIKMQAKHISPASVRFILCSHRCWILAMKNPRKHKKKSISAYKCKQQKNNKLTAPKATRTFQRLPPWGTTAAEFWRTTWITQGWCLHGKYPRN